MQHRLLNGAKRKLSLWVKIPLARNIDANEWMGREIEAGVVDSQGLAGRRW